MRPRSEISVSCPLPRGGAAAFASYGWSRSGGTPGCALVEAAVGSVLVVMLEVLNEQAPELAFVPDDGAVEELLADGANPPLGERVGLGRVVRSAHSATRRALGPTALSWDSSADAAGAATAQQAL